MKNKSVLILLLSLFSMILTGCGGKYEHKPLHGIYYGYYSNGDPQNFLILAFGKYYPNKVGFRQSQDNSKLDSVFKATYGRNYVILHTPEKNIKLDISKDNKILSCTSCNGINGPKTFSDTDNNGKIFDSSVGDIAYSNISKNAKDRGTYLQEIKEAK